MPTYQYECSACGHQLEELQSMTEPKLSQCPQCGKKRLQRLIGTGAGIIFKGTGFYETDYKKKGPDKAGSSTEKSASKSACGSSCACHNPNPSNK